MADHVDGVKKERMAQQKSTRSGFLLISRAKRAYSELRCIVRRLERIRAVCLVASDVMQLPGEGARPVYIARRGSRREVANGDERRISRMVHQTRDSGRRGGSPSARAALSSGSHGGIPTASGCFAASRTATSQRIPCPQTWGSRYWLAGRRRPHRTSRFRVRPKARLTTTTPSRRPICRPTPSMGLPHSSPQHSGPRRAPTSAAL